MENNKPQPGNTDDSDSLAVEIARIEASSEETAQSSEMEELKDLSKLKLDKFRESENKKRVSVSESDDNRYIGFKKQRRSHQKAVLFCGMLIFTGLTAAWLLPESRYTVLNSLGQKGSLVIQAREPDINDRDNLAEITNFTAIVDGREYKSGAESQITVGDLSYGPYDIEVKKSGYAGYKYQATVGFDPYLGLLGSATKEGILIAELQATGLKISFTIKDWASRLPLKIGEFKLGDRISKPDDNGQVTVIVPSGIKGKVKVETDINNGYLSRPIEIDTEKSEQEAFIVPGSRHYFASKRNGLISVYSSYIDGSDLKELIKGTAHESPGLQFTVSPGDKYAAFVTTRDGHKDAKGGLIQKLYWVDLTDGKMDPIDSGSNIRLLDWNGENLAYVTSDIQDKETFQRHRLRVLDSLTKNRYDIAMTTGSFSDIFISHETLIFTQAESEGQPGFEKGAVLKTAGIKGENSRELAAGTKVLRQLGADSFFFQTDMDKWNELNINTNQLKPAQPPGGKDIIYLSNPNGSNQRLAVEEIYEKRALILQDSDGSTKQLTAQDGLTGPIRFLNTTTIQYRLITSKEAADYVVSSLGGEPRKITDVAAAPNPQQDAFSFN